MRRAGDLALRQQLRGGKLADVDARFANSLVRHIAIAFANENLSVGQHGTRGEVENIFEIPLAILLFGMFVQFMRGRHSGGAGGYIERGIELSIGFVAKHGITADSEADHHYSEYSREVERQSGSGRTGVAHVNRLHAQDRRGNFSLFQRQSGTGNNLTRV